MLLDTKPAQQQRSRATSRRILEAVAELLDAGGSLDDISVGEIAAKAGVSIGGFYARFSSKDAALVQLFDDSFADRWIGWAEEVLSPERCADQRASELLGEYVRFIARAFREHRSLVRQIALWHPGKERAAHRSCSASERARR